jgi:DNA polymerase I-like protein with 3'-5' exonuclease and polymerase domains
MQKQGWTWGTVPYDFAPYWCVPETTEILTSRGWLKHDEVHEGDKTLGYDNGNLRWTPVLKVSRFSGAPLVSIGRSWWNTVCTPDHRWVMQHRSTDDAFTEPYIASLRDAWRSTAALVLAGYADEAGTSSVTPGEAAMIAWLSTDGHIAWQRPRSSPNACVFQSDRKFTAELRELLKSENAYVSERIASSGGDNRSFYVSAPYVQALWDKAQLFDQSMSAVVLSLNPAARKAWLDAVYMADGEYRDKHYRPYYLPGGTIAAYPGAMQDAIALAVYLEGYRPQVSSGKTVTGSFGKPVISGAGVRIAVRRITGQKQNKPVDAGYGDVWCPTTGSGTWTARDASGNIFVTGNCYGALDPVLTCHIWEKKKSVLAEFGPSYQIEMSATRIATNMKVHGAHIDVPYTEAAIAKLKAYSQDIRGWLKSGYGVTSPMAGGQIGGVLEAAGVEIQFWTDGGAPQFDKDALAFYTINYPQVSVFCEQVLAVRQAEKKIGTYLENFLLMKDADDMLHPSLWVNGARTSRMSCSDPNLQNLIRDDKIVRGAFIPDNPDHVLVTIDANQIEARLVAHFSDDPGLIAAFQQADATGQDFFSIIAGRIFQTEISKKDPRRQRTKNTIYSKMYGASVHKMALTAGIPVMQMQEFHDALIRQFPGLELFMKSSIHEASANSYRGKPAIYTPSGRRLLMTKGKEYTAANYKVQGHAAEVLKMGMHRLDAAGYGPYMVIPVHDEVLFSVPKENAEALMHEAEEVLANRTDYAVPITWGGDIMAEGRWSKK